jgi:translation elongation factor P/translation initiation factor 5A
MRITETTTRLATAAVLAGLLVGGLPAIAAEKTAQKPVVSETVKATAAVKAVDYDKRLITLQGPDGKVFTVEAGPEVKRLKEIKAGDTVVVQYTQALAAELKKTGAPSGTAVKEDVSRAKAGEAPGIKGTREVKATVTIDSVDLKNNIVTFTGPQGNVNIVAVQRPQMREFLKTLKAGDKVDLTFTEAMAISVEPANKK